MTKRSRIKHTPPPQRLVDSVPDSEGQPIVKDSGLFAVGDILGVQPKRALGREIEHAEVFQCFGVWREGTKSYVAVSERGWLQKRGVESKLFRKIG